jgi:hypothetical protein
VLLFLLISDREACWAWLCYRSRLILQLRDQFVVFVIQL